eukprot:TRINITY_DN3002_c0_g1_i1.p2 TRINITY_DN3002_c0_g1~~TRINITY_DN3002_c0_g1_i1.p2  ORF type:complete len:113 (+),score=14.61 TRINITY_DN3002_c0_g1_i1:541-879(+)
MSAGGMQETLKWLQNLIGWINGILKWVYGLFQWKQEWLTKYIFIALSASTLYSLFFPFQYVALVIGVYLICMWTVPVKVVWIFCAVLAFYVFRARPEQRLAHIGLQKLFTEK